MKASLRCWFCDVTALARSWTSSDGWFQGESPADRLPGQPWARWREKQESPGAQERASCMLARCFKQSDLDTAHRRLVESECLYGAEPRPCPWFLPSLHFHVTKNKLLPMY